MKGNQLIGLCLSIVGFLDIVLAQFVLKKKFEGRPEAKIIVLAMSGGGFLLLAAGTAVFYGLVGR